MATPDRVSPAAERARRDRVVDLGAMNGDEPTVEDMLRRLDLATRGWPGAPGESRAPCFRFNMTGRLAPLFWCFNGGADAAAMAAALGGNRPLHAFRSMNRLTSSAEAKARLAPVMADIYAQDIADSIGAARVVIGGDCQAGAIAERIARRRLADGCEGLSLILLDHAPDDTPPCRTSVVLSSDGVAAGLEERLRSRDIAASVDRMPFDRRGFYAAENADVFFAALRRRIGPD